MCVRIREFQCGFTNAGFVVMMNNEVVKLLAFFVYSWMTFMQNSSGNFKHGVSYVWGKNGGRERE